MAQNWFRQKLAWSMPWNEYGIQEKLYFIMLCQYPCSTSTTYNQKLKKKTSPKTVQSAADCFIKYTQYHKTVCLKTACMCVCVCNAYVHEPG